MNSPLLAVPFETARRYPERVSHKWKTKDKSGSRTYGEFAHTIRILAAGLKDAGVTKGDHVGFFINNRFEWICTDFALMALGAVSVPRGSDSAPKEVEFIFHHSDSRHLIVETVQQLCSLDEVFSEKDWERCAAIFVVDDEEKLSVPARLAAKVHFYSALLAAGETAFASEPDLLEKLEKSIKLDDLLTIVYTSGTTGNPKGVMLSHANFIQNLVANTPRLEIDIEKAETTVLMLPSWHVYERAFEYCGIASGLTFVYSSAGRFGADLVSERPQVLISVPRVWESVYQKFIKAFSEMRSGKRNLVLAFIKGNQVWMTSSLYLHGGYISLHDRSVTEKILAALWHSLRFVIYLPIHKLAGVLFKPFREKVGGRLRLATCGAGSLPKYLDELFNAIGITLINAYGMTECAPGILSRQTKRNTFGSTGIPFDNTEVEIRLEDGSIAGTGEKGVLYVRGPQVMSGYYKNQIATTAVLSPDGWMSTGDLAVRSENGEYIIVGRAKDTIVLMGGENIEPEPIEDKLKESAYIDHAVVVGQDQKQLSAIVAVNEDELMKLAEELKLSRNEILIEGSASIENDKIYNFLLQEVNSRISKEQGFKPFERITKIFPVLNDFSVGKELTQTLKVKRKFVEERFRQMVDKYFKGGDKGTK
ncbi:MAG TPA: AMP-binding protein [Rectinemataceae bacterium]|nr:AMP-binding protein [Rectinemataceae bacterium]